ncbi:MAG: VanW family protein [Methanoregulaceae archaeon]|nr:VanW family protein [Methanoregulaceae archaeon]
MKRVLVWFGVLSGTVVIGFALMASQYEPKAAPGTRVGEIDIEGLTAEQAAFRIRQWWEQEKGRTLQLRLPGGEIYEDRASRLGLSIDDSATVAQVDFESLLDSIKRAVKGSAERPKYDLVFKPATVDTKPLSQFVEKHVPERKPARVVFRNGAIERTPEVAGFRLDASRVFDATLIAFRDQAPVELPLKLDEKKVPDEVLSKITDVVSEFSTRFSEGKASRSTNIRLAARKIDGLVLAPGESFSFNGVVGKRTREAGFKEAGVYKDGKHDIDIGGGICQVSTTLYNAVLFANLKVTKRQNHSMPVPYVPIGRDAAVDYNRIDLGFTNTLDIPVAINSQVETGKITFRVLGQKDPSLSVKIESSDRRSWAVGEKVQRDPSLPEGKRRVIEKGSGGHSINTFRVVYRDGKELKREPLGRSHYRGGVRIVAVGTAAPVADVTPEPAGEINPSEGDISGH